ncbi:MAG: hypothetical protein FJ399_01300 [Verrucomicrobia bacterium]|nr:hypothetical protein [Verrucomicrobiota bacterium]
MKFVFLLGGATGFACTALASWLSRHTADRILFDAALGCLVGAVLFRWFWNILVQGMREVLQQRHAAAATAASAPAPAGRTAGKEKHPSHPPTT